MKKIATMVAVAALSVGLLTGCGSKNPAKADREITLQLGPGMKYDQTEIKMKKGENVKINLENKDTGTAHTFILQGLNNPKSKQIAAGAKESVTVTASSTGRFTYFCDVAGHKEGGMHGEIVVE